MTYVAIDPEAVTDLARELSLAADAATASRLAVDRTLRSAGVAARAPDRLAAVASSCASAAADLRRRLAELARLQVLYRRVGETGPVYPRPDTSFGSFAEARAAGSALGREFAALAHGDGWYHEDRVLPLLTALGDHAHDPHFCAAFFAAMPPVLGLYWVRQLSELSRLRDFPARDDAIAPYLTALGSGLAGDPALLRAYLGPLTHELLPAEVRDVLRYGRYDDDTTLALTLSAVDRSVGGARGIEPWNDDAGLLDAIARDPALAQRFLAALPDDTLRQLLGTRDGLLSGIGTVVCVAGSGPDAASLHAVERIVVTVGRHDTHLAPDVQNGVAFAMAAHLDSFGHDVTYGVYPGGMRQDELVRAFVRVMDDNDAAMTTLHEAGAALTSLLLSRRAALGVASPEIGTLGGAYGLLARADADSALDRAAASAAWWTMAAQAVSLVPLPGPALPVAVGKNAIGALLSGQADAARARGSVAAEDFVDHAYDQGRLLLAVALASRAAEESPAAGAALAPPAALRHADGTLKTFAELTPADDAAWEEWLSRPTPWTVPVYDGTPARATLEEMVAALTPPYEMSFDRLFRRIPRG